MTIVETIKSGFAKTGKKLGYHEDKQNVTWIEWSTLALIALFCFFTFSYIDLQTIMNNTVLFAKSVINGNFLGFYDYSIQNYTTNWAANYEIIIYILFAIWNLPVIIAALGFNVDYATSPLCVFWEKMMLVVAAYLCAKVLMKIFREFGLDKRRSKFGVFLFLSSMYTLFITVVQSQVEIITLLLILVGLYYYIKDDMIKFVLIFAVAVPFKMIAAFIFVPLLLLKCKNILKIILSMIVLVIPEMLCKLPFMNDEAYSLLLKSNTMSTLSSMLKYSVTISSQKFSIFVILFVFICALCYAYKPSCREESIYLVSYIPFVIFSGLLLFLNCSSYWLFIIVPFMIMTTMANKKNLAINMLLDVGISVGWMVQCFTSASAFTNLSRTSSNFFLLRLFAPKEGMELKYTGMKDFLISKNLDQFTPLFFSAMAACIFVFVLINFPYKKREIGNTQPINMAALWVRLGAVILSLAVLIGVYTMKTNVASYDTTECKHVAMEQSVLKKDSVISQKMTFDKNVDLEEVQVMFNNKEAKRSDFGSVVFSIIDENDKKIFEKRTGTSLIPNKKMFTISLKDVKVEAGKEYTFRFTGRDEEGSVFLMITDEFMYNSCPVEANGTKIEKNLYMKVR